MLFVCVCLFLEDKKECKKEGKSENLQLYMHISMVCIYINLVRGIHTNGAPTFTGIICPVKSMAEPVPAAH